jgi:hypothetical protein
VSAYPLTLKIISGCWILFVVIWLIAAFWTNRSVYKESKWQRLGYVIPILVGGYLVFKGQRLSDPPIRCVSPVRENEDSQLAAINYLLSCVPAFLIIRL